MEVLGNAPSSHQPTFCNLARCRRLGLSVAAAQAGPCSSRIAQFEQAVRQAAGNPNAGPMAPQSIGAQLDRQPTPASIKSAEEQAKATFAATLARAKRLDK